MALTQLTDVIIPEVYASYNAVDDMTLTAFYQSGIITQNAQLNAFANTGGHSFNLPFWKDLDTGSEPNISSDDPTVIATPDKVDADKQIGYQSHLNNSWSTADLAGEIAGSDPMMRIRARTSHYWQRQFQKRLIAASNGILADNVANHSGDMVYDISANDAANITNATLFGLTAFTGSTFTMGDAFEALGAIVVHSMVYKRIVDNNEAEDVRNSDGVLLYRGYKGLRLIIDDSMPVAPITTGNGFKYTSVILGAGAFGYGMGKPKNAVEVTREALQGNGGGVEILTERKTQIIHPFGFKSEAGSTENGHALADLAKATNWTRVVARKNVPMAFLITNG